MTLLVCLTHGKLHSTLGLLGTGILLSLLESPLFLSLHLLLSLELIEFFYSDVTQDMTLGMNAHINYDLAIATFESGYAVPQWAPDYYRVNDLMNQIDGNVTHALYDPFPPSLSFCLDFLYIL
jgi:hypothetical protein